MVFRFKVTFRDAGMLCYSVGLANQIPDEFSSPSFGSNQQYGHSRQTLSEKLSMGDAVSKIIPKQRLCQLDGTTSHSLATKVQTTLYLKSMTERKANL